MVLIGIKKYYNANIYGVKKQEKPQKTNKKVE